MSIEITLNGLAAIDPVMVNRNIQGTLNDSSLQWLDVTDRTKKAALCNRFAKLSGPRPSYGYFAMCREDVNKLKNVDITLVMKVNDVKIEEKKLVLVYATSMGPISNDDNPGMNDIFVAEIADRRIYGDHPWFQLDQPGQRMFNIVSPIYGQGEYYIDSMDDSAGVGSEVPWTWQTMFEELWPDYLGTAPTLPTAVLPATNPTNFDFRGYTAYQALNIVLTQLNLSIMPSRTGDGSFGIVDFGDTDTDSANNDQFRNQYMAALDERVEWVEPIKTYYPQGVAVHFAKTATNSGSENVFTKDSGQWYTDMEHIITINGTADQIGDTSKVLTGTYQQIYDDLPCWVDPFSGVIANSSDLQAKAQSRADHFFTDLIKDDFRLHEVYSYLINFKICGTLHAIMWAQSIARGGAWITEIFCHPRLRMQLGGDGTLVPTGIKPEPPYQFRALPMYPPELFVGRVDGTPDANGWFNVTERRPDPATNTVIDGIAWTGKDLN